MTDGPLEIVVAQTDGQLRILVGSKVVVTADSVQALIDQGHLTQSVVPLVLERGTDLRMAVELGERAAILGSVRAGEHLLEELQEKYEVLREDQVFSDVAPIDAANHVDGESWGWLPAAEGPEKFVLVPLVDSVDVAGFRAWMSQSMTGAVLYWGLRMFGAEVAVAWYEADESDPGSSYMRPIYDTSNREALLGYVVGDWNAEDRSARCPVCAEDDEAENYGWELTLQADPDRFSAEARGRVLARIWEPCAKHQRGAVLTNAGVEWRWETDYWIPTEQ